MIKLVNNTHKLTYWTCTLGFMTTCFPRFEFTSPSETPVFPTVDSILTLPVSCHVQLASHYHERSKFWTVHHSSSWQPSQALEAISVGTKCSTNPNTILCRVFEETNSGIKIVHIHDVAFVFKIFHKCLCNSCCQPVVSNRIYIYFLANINIEAQHVSNITVSQ